MQQQTHLTSKKIPRQSKNYANRSCFARLKENFILKCLTTAGVPEIENHAAFPEELRESLVDMVTHAQTTQKVLNKITKTLEVLAKNDKVCQLIQTIPGLGTICSCRLRATIGDIKRFKNPKDFPAYYGLVPRSIATGHNEKKGKITHRGDRTMRSLMVQGAGCVIRLATCGKWLCSE